MIKKEYLKIGIVALSLSIFNTQSSNSQPVQACGSDPSFGPLKCYCCVDGPSGPEPRTLLYTESLVSHSAACNACAQAFSNDGVCDPEAWPVQCTQ